MRGKELQKFNIELFSIRTTTQPRKPVKTVSSEIKEIEKTSEIQVIKAKFEDVSNKLTKTEKLLSNLKLKNKQCIRKIKTSNTTIQKKRQEYSKLKKKCGKISHRANIWKTKFIHMKNSRLEVGHKNLQA